MANATGGTITTSGGKTIHTFTSSGTFAVPYAGFIDVLVVAGGGGGSRELSGSAGGGGGGGIKYSTGLAVIKKEYTVTVGAGGAEKSSSGAGNNGQNSVFSTLTATGGQGGQIRNGGNQGSDPAKSGGTGQSFGSYNENGGGGGGAGANGINAVSGKAGNGGAGASYSITGSSVTYAGGGGGGGARDADRGSGGTGGGGNGCGRATAQAPSAGTANTGGGGGAGNTHFNGQAGGSGVVIISYTTNSLSIIPTVTTGSATNIAVATATLGGNVTSANGGTISSRGVCWSTSENPTTSDDKDTSAGTTGAYTVNATGLSPYTTYHYRAYAINEKGTAYGTDETFTTLAVVSNPILKMLIDTVENWG